ncbi:MAG: phenylalanine--tRNA ligase beta subunit-related protein [Polyangiaceae bacterium]
MEMGVMRVSVARHPLLDAAVFVTELGARLGEMAVPEGLSRLLAAGVEAPLSSDDAVRGAVRDLLRHGGFKPTGRSKPASEYLIRAVGDGALSSINLAVDACNVASLHSGLPISVVDLDRAKEPLSIGIAAAGTSYVFNASGQVIDVGGLLCLCDAEGACANAVKDSQRTKTNEATRRTLSVVWGTKALGDRTARTARWYRELLEAAGATTADAEVQVVES